jgi:metallo-beta-lactamase class B
MWWFGTTGVGAFLITSPQGYILVDALNNEQEARTILFDGMRKVGLDPALIKNLVYGHFHLDHTGGGRVLETLYKPQAIMGRDDWSAYFTTMAAGTGQAARLTDRTPMSQGIVATDGMKITVGDITATIHTMTGHTVGSIGMIVPIKWGGREHPILIVTAATDTPNRNSFVGGYEHIWDKGIEAKVEAVYQVHPNTNMNLLARTKYVTDNWPVRENPLIYGADKTRRYLEIMRACTQARMDALGWPGA